MISIELNTFRMISEPEVPAEIGSAQKTIDKDFFKVDTNDGDFMANAATKSESIVGESDGSSSGSDKSTSTSSTSSLSVDVSAEGSVSTPQGSGGGGASLGVRDFCIIYYYFCIVRKFLFDFK